MQGWLLKMRRIHVQLLRVQLLPLLRFLLVRLLLIRLKSYPCNHPATHPGIHAIIETDNCPGSHLVSQLGHPGNHPRSQSDDLEIKRLSNQFDEAV